MEPHSSEFTASYPDHHPGRPALHRVNSQLSHERGLGETLSELRAKIGRFVTAPFRAENARPRTSLNPNSRLENNPEYRARALGEEYRGAYAEIENRRKFSDRGRFVREEGPPVGERSAKAFEDLDNGG